MKREKSGLLFRSRNARRSALALTKGRRSVTDFKRSALSTEESGTEHFPRFSQSSGFANLPTSFLMENEAS